MNLKTTTFDADLYQLVPKVATFKMQDDGVSSLQETHDAGQWNECGGFSIRDSESCYTAMLAAAPQPPELSPLMPIESAPKDGRTILIYAPSRMTDRLIYEGYWSELANDFAMIGGFIILDTATHWMEKPQAPTAPEVE